MQRIWRGWFQVGNKYGVGLWDEGENTQTRVRCKPDGIPKALITKLMGMWVPDLPSGS